MFFDDVHIDELKCTRKKGKWYAQVNGEEVLIDWDDDIFQGSWPYRHQGTDGQISFVNTNGVDDPFFSSQPGADLQRLNSLTLNSTQDFVKWMWVSLNGEESNLLEIFAPKPQ